MGRPDAPVSSGTSDRGVSEPRTTDRPPLALSARVYAKRFDWLIVPLYGVVDGRCECGVDQCRPIGKHPRTRHGVKDASRDEAQLVEWWTNYPNSNLGIATGVRSNLIVLDVDADRGGDRALAELEDRYGPLPATVRAVTGKGEHLYFSHPGRRISNSSDEIAEGLDIRGDGGYVVAPPSLHANGRSYAWEDGHNPREISVAPPPGSLLDAIRRPARVQAEREKVPSSLGAPARFAYAYVLDGVEEGSRNTSIFLMASSLRGLGTQPALIEDLALHAAKNCTPPYPEQEALEAARSTLRYPTNAQRRATRAVSPERLAILEVLHSADLPLQPRDVARVLEKPRESVKMLLSMMARDEQVARVDGGYVPSFGAFIARLAAARDADQR